MVTQGEAEQLILTGLKSKRSGDFDVADSHFLKASENPAVRENALVQYAICAQATGDFEHLEGRLHEVVGLCPENLELQVRLMHVEGMRGSLNQYREQLLQLIDQLDCSHKVGVGGGRQLLLAIHYALNNQARRSALRVLADCVTRQLEAQKGDLRALYDLQACIALARGDLDHLAYSLKFTQDFYPQNARETRLRKVAARLNGAVDEEGVDRKVFGIGLSRTGTHSLTNALNRMGFDAIHWSNPFTRDLIGTDDFLCFDAFTDISISYRFEELFDRFPNASFVYTHRNRSDWTKSISRHYADQRKIFNPFELHNENQSERYAGRLGAIEGALYAPYASWSDAYLAFDERVRSFFSGERKKRLLEIDVTQGERWSKLSAFLGSEAPKTAFPWQGRWRYRSTSDCD
jgi:hypothetical protein